MRDKVLDFIEKKKKKLSIAVADIFLDRNPHSLVHIYFLWRLVQ